MLSAEWKELLTKYSNQIDREHIDILMKLINALRTYNYVNHPCIVWVINNLHGSNCENTYSQSFNICRCQTFYT